MLKNKTHIVVSSFLFLLIASSYSIMAMKYPVAYIVATYEDFFGEWAQFFFFAAVFVISLKLSFRKSKFRVFFIFLSAASFYTSMEEISWGQRIFNITPPELFLKHNLQRETNIHNFITGPYKTAIKSLIEYVLFAGLVLYGMIYPLSIKMNVQFARKAESNGLLAPPLYLWPYFVFSAFLELGLFNLNEAEVAEILIPFGLVILLLHYLAIYRNHDSSDANTLTPVHKTASRNIALSVCAVFILVVIASSAATYASYYSPRLHNQMYDKVMNGVEKFARRYENYKLWDNAIYLYEIIDERDPDRPSIQRQLAHCFKNIGDPLNEKNYLTKALEIDAEKLEEIPDSISVNLSLSRTYDQMGKTEVAESYIKRAFEIARKRVQAKPESASAVYWLGRVYSQSGDNASAVQYYRKAFEWQPHKNKYRSAYINAINILSEKSDLDNEDTDNQEKGDN